MIPPKNWGGVKLRSAKKSEPRRGTFHGTFSFRTNRASSIIMEAMGLCAHLWEKCVDVYIRLR